MNKIYGILFHMNIKINNSYNIVSQILIEHNNKMLQKLILFSTKINKIFMSLIIEESQLFLKQNLINHYKSLLKTLRS